MSINDILSRKGNKVFTLPPDSRIATAAHMLRMEHIGAIVISKDGSHVDGILSERDIIYGLTEHGTAVLDQPASSLMSHNVQSCGPETSIREVMRLMTSHRIRHVPVIADGTLRGIVSIGDIVKTRLEEAEMESNVLRDYAVAHH